MILDQIENYHLYKSVHKKLHSAFKYLKETDFDTLQPGTYSVDGTDILAKVLLYNLHEVVEPMLERHRRYIDMQMVVSGYELLGYEMLREQSVLKPYDSRTDCEYFEGNPSYFRLEPGMFSVLFPHDLHMAGICVDCAERVKKVVLKIEY